jgi:uncharacterized membrane protein YeiH
MELALAFDLAGTFVFALSGAILAVRRGFDIVGIAVLAVSAGLGGGIIRDILLGDLPPSALENEAYLLVALTAGLLGFFFSVSIERRDTSFRVLDAAGLGLFAVTGTAKSLDSDLSIVAAILLGAVSGAGGGVVRDLLAREVPLVLQREVYALAALLGGAVFVAVERGGLAAAVAAPLGVGATFVLRLLAIRYGWQAPRPRTTPAGDDDGQT